jgi:hypothetical protein
MHTGGRKRGVRFGNLVKKCNKTPLKKLTKKPRTPLDFQLLCSIYAPTLPPSFLSKHDFGSSPSRNNTCFEKKNWNFQVLSNYVEGEKNIFESVRLLRAWLKSPQSNHNLQSFLNEAKSLEKAITTLLNGLLARYFSAGDILTVIKNKENVRKSKLFFWGWKLNYTKKFSDMSTFSCICHTYFLFSSSVRLLVNLTIFYAHEYLQYNANMKSLLSFLTNINEANR